MAVSLRTDLRDALLDGTPYRIAIPQGWNGTLLLDLDFVGPPSRPSSPVHEWVLGGGCAVAGTARVMNTVSASVWAHRLLQVLHVVRKTSGRPTRVIAFGQSGGGATARAIAQEMPHSIDAAVVMSTPGSGQVSLLNQALDATFAARALLAPDDERLALVGLPADLTALDAEWTRVLAAAQETSEGRARIALAAALAQLPYWGLDETAAQPPDPGDVRAVQEGLFRELAFVAGRHRAGLRQAVESFAGNPSWNTGVDYARLFEAADPPVRAVVELLYADAGLDVEKDLARVNATARIAADPAGVDYARESSSDGRLAKPLLYMTTTGDPMCPVSNSGPLQTAADAGDLLRMLYVQAAGHCTFTLAETGAALAAVTERIDTGRWPDTGPEAMNRRGNSLHASATRFTDHDPGPGYRPFFAYSDYPPAPALPTAKSRVPGN
jgi:pimeloyl-ACP methyl ester carboxylesterase